MTSSLDRLDAIRILHLSIARMPRAALVLDGDLNVVVANRAARETSGIDCGANLSRRLPDAALATIESARTSGRALPVNLTFGSLPQFCYAWRIDPLPGLDEALVMIKASPINEMAARANRIEWEHGNTAMQLEGIVQERDRLRDTARRLRAMADSDPLTGVLNTRGFRDACMERLLQYRRRAALMFIDLNDFKPVNDIYGHQTGDAVLRIIAERLRGLTRDSDLVGRLGGDEFGIWLDGLEPEEGWVKCNQAEAAIASPVQSTTADKRSEIAISAAVGMAHFPTDGQDFDTLLQVADDRMYRQKRQRRLRPA